MLDHEWALTGDGEGEQARTVRERALAEGDWPRAVREWALTGDGDGEGERALAGDGEGEWALAGDGEGELPYQ